LESQVITAATVLLVIGGACFGIRAVIGPSLADRVVAIDGLVVTMVATIVVHSIRTGTSWFLAVAVVVTLVGFVGTTAGARFIERQRRSGG
jgi:multicomponent Na+:H+ antiporter subunit F